MTFRIGTGCASVTDCDGIRVQEGDAIAGSHFELNTNCYARDPDQGDYIRDDCVTS